MNSQSTKDMFFKPDYNHIPEQTTKTHTPRLDKYPFNPKPTFSSKPQWYKGSRDRGLR